MTTQTNQEITQESSSPQNPFENLHLPEQQRANERSRRNKVRNKELLKTELMRLQKLYNEQTDNKDKRQVLTDWGRKHVGSNYPGLGETVAYAFPPVFLVKPAIHDTSGTGAYIPKDGSDVKGCRAACKVELAFRLLSSSRERNGRIPLVVISSLVHEKVLTCLEKARDIFDKDDRELLETCSDVIVNDPSSRYFKIPTEEQRGETDLIILDQNVGVVFVEVKAYGDQKGKNKTKIKKKALKQLERSEEMFMTVFSQDPDILTVPRHKVLALPDALEIDVKEDPTSVCFLTKDNLLKESIATAESNYDLTHFERWWNATFTKPRQLLSAEKIQDIVSILVGTFSKDCTMTGFDHVRTMNDAISYTGEIFRSKTFTSTDLRDLQENKESLDSVLQISKEYARCHLKGSTRSGKTTLTILKASKFLDFENNNHVIVVDIYRGTAGRPGGYHAFKSIKGKTNKPGSTRVLRLKLDANKDMNCFDSGLKELCPNILPKNLMFFIDQIFLDPFLEAILEKLTSDYKDSHVWCTNGLLEQSLGEKYDKEFKQIYLPRLARVPPSVKKVLYQADWVLMEEKMEKYDLESAYNHKPEKKSRSLLSSHQNQGINEIIKFDTNVCISMQGPIVLSVRHQNHRLKKKIDMLDCEHCAEELAELLSDKLNLFENHDEVSGGAAKQAILDCNIAILFSIPQDLYRISSHLGEEHVEICQSKCEEYSQKVASSKLIQKLQDSLAVDLEIVKLLPGETTREDEANQDYESERLYNKVILCWVDNFQGVDRDVVIYLPSEKARKRKLPVPGVTVSQTHSLDASVEATSATPATETGNAPYQMQKSKADKRKMAHLYWSNDDIERYSDWDKTNLMFAGTRAEGQLILMVP